MKKYISTILVSTTFFLLSAQSTSAGAAYVLTYSCLGACPQATNIYINLDLDKSSYSPNEQVVLYGDVSSDDNPQPVNAVSPIGKGKLPGGSWSADMFPITYSDFAIKNTVYSSVVLGNAPVTAGSYTATAFGGSGGYRSQSNQPIPFTVANPVPSVSLYFSYLKEKVKAFML